MSGERLFACVDRVTAAEPTTGRRPGCTRRRGQALHVRVFSGTDPGSGRDVYLTTSTGGRTPEPAPRHRTGRSPGRRGFRMDDDWGTLVWLEVRLKVPSSNSGLRKRLAHTRVPGHPGRAWALQRARGPAGDGLAPMGGREEDPGDRRRRDLRGQADRRPPGEDLAAGPVRDRGDADAGRRPPASPVQPHPGRRRAAPPVLGQMGARQGETRRRDVVVAAQHGGRGRRRDDVTALRRRRPRRLGSPRGVRQRGRRHHPDGRDAVASGHRRVRVGGHASARRRRRSLLRPAPPGRHRRPRVAQSLDTRVVRAGHRQQRTDDRGSTPG
ncbi:MAG: hypothetical protein V7633_2671 [Pseudonocardia sp.]